MANTVYQCHRTVDVQVVICGRTVTDDTILKTTTIKTNTVELSHISPILVSISRGPSAVRLSPTDPVGMLEVERFGLKGGTVFFAR